MIQTSMTTPRRKACVECRQQKVFPHLPQLRDTQVAMMDGITDFADPM
jgi:hypothetical protein